MRQSVLGLVLWIIQKTDGLFIFDIQSLSDHHSDVIVLSCVDVHTSAFFMSCGEVLRLKPNVVSQVNPTSVNGDVRII